MQESKNQVGRREEMMGVGVDKGLSWRYHPGICLVRLRKNLGRTSVRMTGRWNWTYDLPNLKPTLYNLRSPGGRWPKFIFPHFTV